MWFKPEKPIPAAVTVGKYIELAQILAYVVWAVIGV
jgi:hypothetical protein